MIHLPSLAVLVVETHRGMRAQLGALLSGYGVTNLQFAHSAADAVRKLRERRFDIILCEYNLGEGQDGQHLLEDLRTQGTIPPDTLFIIITGERNYEKVVGAAELAPDDYILKPLTADTLNWRLLRVLEKREAFLPVHRLVASGEPQAAIDACREAEAVHPRYRSDFLRLRAELHADLRQNREAEALYRDVLANRAVPWARLGLAKVLFASRRYAESEEILVSLLSDHGHFLGAYDWLARVRRECGRLDEARDTLVSAVGLSPHRVGRLRQLGEVSLAMGDHPTAERALAEVVRKGRHSDFRSPEDHVRLVRAQIGQGRVAEAGETIRDLEASMDGVPGTVVCASLAKALYHERRGEPQRAQAALQRAVHAGRDKAALSAGIRQQLVEACLDSGLEAEGSALVMEILRTSADEHTVNATRTLLRERGLEDLGHALEQRVHEEVKGLVAVGAEKARAGDYDGAVNEMMSAVRRMPGNPHVTFNAALALLRHIEHRGWNERFVTQARALIARTRHLAPSYPRLAAIDAFLRQLAQQHAAAAGRGTARKLGGTA